MKIRDLPGGILVLAMTGLTASLFAINTLWWWLAHHMAWWTCALLMTGGTLLWSVTRASMDTYRSRKPKTPRATG